MKMINYGDWAVSDLDIGDMFRKMVIQHTNKLFNEHRNHTPSEEEVF